MYNILLNDKGVGYFSEILEGIDFFVQHIEDQDSSNPVSSIIPKWTEWYPSNDNSKPYGKQKNIDARVSDALYSDAKSAYIVNTLKQAASVCFKNYAFENSVDASLFKISDRIAINKYDTLSFMGPHQDGTQDGLKFSVVMYLNEDYEGGEIFFPELDIKIKPKMGSLVIFPSTHIHSSLEVKSGTKYIATMFIMDINNITV
jgi:hypothetical protein